VAFAIFEAADRKNYGQKPLVLFCAAGIKPPVEAIARDYERTFGRPVQCQYAGSGTLLSNLRVADAGDLFLPADESYVRTAREQGLLAEVIPLARQRPVMITSKGNAKNIHKIEDLLRPDVRVALANPDAASVGRTVREMLQRTGQWAALEKHATVFKPTVNDIANDVKIGSVDVGIVWDATARQYPELEAVALPLFDGAVETISICVLRRSPQPTAALRFARYLGARDMGLQQFARFHYEPVEGDEWAERPDILLFSGAIAAAPVSRRP